MLGRWQWSQGDEPNPMFPLGTYRDVRVRRQVSVQARQPVLHGVLDARDKGLGVKGLVERLIVEDPAPSEVLGDIVIRVAIAIGTLNPDLFTADPLAKRLEDTDFIVDPIDAGVPRPVLFDHEFPQPRPHNPCQWHVVERHVLLATLAMGLEPGESFNHRAMERIIRPKREGLQQVWHHLAVMMAVGAPHNTMHMIPVGWTFRPRFVDQTVQGFFSNDREHHRADGAVWLGDGRFRQFIKECGLAVDVAGPPATIL